MRHGRSLRLQVGINMRVMVYNPNPRTRDEETVRDTESLAEIPDRGSPRQAWFHSCKMTQVTQTAFRFHHCSDGQACFEFAHSCPFSRFIAPLSPDSAFRPAPLVGTAGALFRIVW